MFEIANRPLIEPIRPLAISPKADRKKASHVSALSDAFAMNTNDTMEVKQMKIAIVTCIVFEF